MGLIKNRVQSTVLCSIIPALLNAGGCVGKGARAESAPAVLQRTNPRALALPVTQQVPIKPVPVRSTASTSIIKSPIQAGTVPITLAPVGQQASTAFVPVASLPQQVAPTLATVPVTMPVAVQPVARPAAPAPITQDTGAGVGAQAPIMPVPVVAPAMTVAPQQQAPAQDNTSLVYDPRVRWGAVLFIIWVYWDSIKKQFEPKKEEQGDALVTRALPRKVVELRIAPKKLE